MLLHGVKGQKHKISISLRDDPIVVNLTLLIHIVNVPDDPINLICTRHVFWNKHENTLCRKTADSFLSGTNTTLQYTQQRNLSPKIKLIEQLSKKLKNVVLTHSTAHGQDGSFNLMMNNVVTYIRDNRNVNPAYKTHTFRFEFSETKKSHLSLTSQQIAMSFLNSNSAIVLAAVMDKLFNQNLKGIVNFQRIEKRNFGVIP
jgi:hypothetical protein